MKSEDVSELTKVLDHDRERIDALADRARFAAREYVANLERQEVQLDPDGATKLSTAYETGYLRGSTEAMEATNDTLDKLKQTFAVMNEERKREMTEMEQWREDRKGEIAEMAQLRQLSAVANEQARMREQELADLSARITALENTRKGRQ